MPPILSHQSARQPGRPAVRGAAPRWGNGARWAEVQIVAGSHPEVGAPNAPALGDEYKGTAVPCKHVRSGAIPDALHFTGHFARPRSNTARSRGAGRRGSDAPTQVPCAPSGCFLRPRAGKERVMPKKDLTEIIVVLDRSGSMGSIRTDMEGGFNAFIDEQRKLPGECTVTLTRFDTEYDVVYSGKPIADVPPLALEPRGGTALLDAIGRTINDTGARLAALAENERPERVLFVVITDGHENASKEYERSKVLEMVKHQTERYSWQFVYFGANQDAIAVGAALGIHQAANFTADAAGTSRAYQSLNASTSNYRSGRGYTP